MENLKELKYEDIANLEVLKDNKVIPLDTTNLDWKAYGNLNCFGLFIFHPVYKKWTGHQISDKTLSAKEIATILKTACNWMFEQEITDEIWGITPKDRKDALVMANQLGFRRSFETDEHIISILSKE